MVGNRYKATLHFWTIELATDEREPLSHSCTDVTFVHHHISSRWYQNQWWTQRKSYKTSKMHLLPSGFRFLVFMWTSSASSRTRFMYSSKPFKRDGTVGHKLVSVDQHFRILILNSRNLSFPLYIRHHFPGSARLWNSNIGITYIV